MSAWGRLSSMWREPLKVNSAYRSPEHNAKVGGAKKSQHMHGNAFDVDVSHLSRKQRLDLIAKAKQAGFRGVGVYNNALHFDVGGERAWGSDYTRGSLPEWAQQAVSAPAGSYQDGQGGEMPAGYVQTAQGQPQNYLAPQEPQKPEPFQMQNTLQNPADYMSRPVNQLAQGGFSPQDNPFLSYLRQA